MSDRLTSGAGPRPAGGLPFALFLAGWAFLFGCDLLIWFRFGLESSLYSYTLLIPCISLYLLRDKRLRQIRAQAPAWGGHGLIVAGTVCAALALGGWGRWDAGGDLNRFRLVVMVVALVGGLVLWWGFKGWRARMFPALFLFFMIPLPPGWEHALSMLLQRASGWLAYYLIRGTGTPIVREGPFLILPDLLLEVAEECSGIRSTLVLVITSALAAYLFLQRFPIRAAFVAVVLPLGIFRNAFRILVISLLTIYVDPEVIRGPLHRRGGPLFFGLSLLVLMAWGLFLRRWERRSAKDNDRSYA